MVLRQVQERSIIKYSECQGKDKILTFIKNLRVLQIDSMCNPAIKVVRILLILSIFCPDLIGTQVICGSLDGSGFPFLFSFETEFYVAQASPALFLPFPQDHWD